MTTVSEAGSFGRAIASLWDTHDHPDGFLDVWQALQILLLKVISSTISLERTKATFLL